MTISRIGQPAGGSGINNSTTSVYLNATPSSGNILVLAFGSVQAYSQASISNITQTGVAWTKQKSSDTSAAGWYMDSEIWVGVVGSGASTTITINHGNATETAADVCEYSGILTSGFLDQSAAASNSSDGTYPQTGTTSTTSQPNELWVGSIWEYGDPGSYSYMNTCTTGFTLMDGATVSNYPMFNCLGYLESIVTTTGPATAQVGPCTRPWCGCIATFKAAGGSGTTIVVPSNGLYTGTGSKQTTVSYNGASVIMQVDSNFNDWESSAVIENLVIDGQNASGTVGILLENVYNCNIRNITIQNCDVGIQIDICAGTGPKRIGLNTFRMINVKKGILFTNNSTGDDEAFTVIDDVGIELRNDSNAVGIQIGDLTLSSTLLKPYASFIKATVWMKSAGGTGMLVNG